MPSMPSITLIDPDIDSRSISFENPTGARGAGGKLGDGRKGRPFHIFTPGERQVIADIDGPGTVRHIWMTIDFWAPETMRAIRLEVFYDDLEEPSISVPVLDFFGLPHGRAAEFSSELINIQQGHGFNTYVPMPFGRRFRMEFVNDSARHVTLFYQLDYTLEPARREPTSYLHVTFRRENPTTLKRDFVIATGLRGPGRYLGCVIGVRTIDPHAWYGEGEVKIYRDGDRDYPTYCGTGLEDYVGSAWGMGVHWTPYAGVPLLIRPDRSDADDPTLSVGSTYVGFYRWHVPDPIMFAEELTVTIQQIGSSRHFQRGEEAAYEEYRRQNSAAGAGWLFDVKFQEDSLGFAIQERIDDYSAAAFVYCREPQAVPRFDVAVAIADIARTPSDPPKFGQPDDEWDAFNVTMRRNWGGPVDAGGDD